MLAIFKPRKFRGADLNCFITSILVGIRSSVAMSLSIILFSFKSTLLSSYVLYTNANGIPLHSVRYVCVSQTCDKSIRFYNTIFLTRKNKCWYVLWCMTCFSLFTRFSRQSSSSAKLSQCSYDTCIIRWTLHFHENSALSQYGPLKEFDCMYLKTWFEILIRTAQEQHSYIYSAY